MITNRIRDLRKRARLTLQQIATAVGSTTTTIQRLEKGEVELVHPLLEPIARELGVAWPELIGVNTSPETAGLAESAQALDPAAGGPLDRSQIGPHDAAFSVRDDSLSALGIAAGDIIVCDVSARAVRDVATGDIVVAQVYGPGLAEAVTIVRQFVAPALLVTNRRRGRQDVLNLEEADAAIKGVARSRWGAIGRR